MLKTAMILAAGRGQRLRPLTDHLPKPLIEIAGKPLLIHHIDKLASAGFTRIIINHAWLGGQIRRAVLNEIMYPSVDVYFSPEPPGGLETGGGIVNALPLLGDKPFLTINADICTDYDYSTLNAPTANMIHMVLVPNPVTKQQGDFGLSTEGFITNHPRTHTAAGITCYHPAVFKEKVIGRYSVNQLWRELAQALKITGEIYQGAWRDIGTDAVMSLQ